MSAAWWFGLAVLFCNLRLLAIQRIRHRGCDAYNILLNAEVLRRDRRLPITLPPFFRLENPEQWYPPGFLILVALLPEKWLQRNYWVINQLIDLAHLLLMLTVLTHAGVPATGCWCPVIAYATAGGVINEFATLNTRPLGLFLASVFLVAVFLATQTAWGWLLVAAIGVTLFFSHKLSQQFLWFALPVLSLVTTDPVWILSLVLVYSPAFLLWPRGARKIIEAHRNIVVFWGRNWPLLGAHAVRQSPVYGNCQPVPRITIVPISAVSRIF